MNQRCRPLVDVVAQITDPRGQRGKRHSLVALLSLVCAATLCGYRSYSAMAEWGRHYGGTLREAVGLRSLPCAATLHRLLRRLDAQQGEEVIGGWAQEVLAATSPVAREGVALDGKALRGSHKQGASSAHLLSALSHRLGLTLAQYAVADKTNEITAVGHVLNGLLLHGRVFTMDALLTQRAVAQTIVEGAGAYVMVAKGNRPRLCADIAAVFATPAPLAAPVRTAQTVNTGHGRVERRRLLLRALLPGDCDWPGAAQVFRIERRVISQRTGEVPTEVTDGITSLTTAEPAHLLALLRGHWHIENKSHYVRDVTFGEDHSQVRCGAIPQVLATFRNLAIGLLRATGEPNIAAACRRCAAQPAYALALLGIAGK